VADASFDAALTTMLATSYTRAKRCRSGVGRYFPDEIGSHLVNRLAHAFCHLRKERFHAIGASRSRQNRIDGHGSSGVNWARLRATASSPALVKP
jgi:hypothetical protein